MQNVPEEAADVPLPKRRCHCRAGREERRNVSAFARGESHGNRRERSASATTRFFSCPNSANAWRNCRRKKNTASAIAENRWPAPQFNCVNFLPRHKRSLQEADQVEAAGAGGNISPTRAAFAAVEKRYRVSFSLQNYDFCVTCHASAAGDGVSAALPHPKQDIPGCRRGRKDRRFCMFKSKFSVELSATSTIKRNVLRAGIIFKVSQSLLRQGHSKIGFRFCRFAVFAPGRRMGSCGLQNERCAKNCAVSQCFISHSTLAMRRDVCPILRKYLPVNQVRSGLSRKPVVHEKITHSVRVQRRRLGKVSFSGAISVSGIVSLLHAG